MQILLLVYLFIGFVATAKGPLFPPRKVTARVTSPYSLQIRWRDPSLRQGVKDGRRYFVRYQAQAKNRSEENEREEFIKLSKRRLKIYGLLPNTTYSVAVKVVKGKRSSAWSDIIQVTTSEERIDDSMVQNVTATALSSSSVALSWQLPKTTDGVGSYIVIAQSTNGKGRQRKSALSNETTSYVVQNLRPNQLYSFRIQSVKDIPPHSMSRQVIARPFSAKPSRPPNAFKLRLTNSSVVIISWKPPNPRSRNGPLIGYRISYKRKRSRKSDIQFVTAKKDQKVYELKDIMRNTTYKVRIAALNINGTGPFTRWKSIFVEPVKVTDNDNQKLQPSTPVRLEVSGPTPDPSPSPPSEIKLVNRTGSTLYLTWPVPPTPECCPVMAYRITVQNLNDSTDVKQLVKGSAQVHITALHPDTMYRVNVTTLNSAGESQVSEQLIVSTSGFVPPEVTYIHAEAAVLGNDANLTCKAKGQELPSLEWYLQSSQGYVNIVDIGKTNLSISKRAVVTTSTDGHDLKTSSLILYEVTRMAEMEYVCIAKNSVGFKRKTLTLIVNEPPEIIYAEGMTVLEEAKARLVCEARGKPLPEIMWIHERLRTAIAETEEPSYTEGMYVRSTHDLETLTRLSYLEIPQVHHYNYGDYACVAKSLSGQDHATVRLDIQELPPQVTKIQTIALSPSRVSVNWLRPLNYSYAIPFYQVSYRQMRRGSPVLYKNVTRVGTELYGLEHNTVYLIGVIAGTAGGLGEAGPEVKVQTLTNERLEPVNVSAVFLNSSVIKVKWAAPSHVGPMFIRGFRIYYREEGNERTEQRFVSGGHNNQFLLTGVTHTVVYFLKVTTLTTWGYEASSPWTRLAARAYESHPSKPEDVKAEANHDGITLSWRRPRNSNSLEGFIVVFSPASDPDFVTMQVLPANVSTVQLYTVKPLTEYIITIKAFNKYGESQASYARATTPSYAPSIVQHAQILPVSPTEIHLKWEDPSRGHVTRYHIRYWRPGRREKQSAWMTGNFRNYVAGSLRKGSNYRFEIIPYNGAIPGEAVVMFTSTLEDRPDGPPLDIKLRALNESILVATWQPPDPELANGKIKGYRLVLKVKGGKRISSFRLSSSRRNFTFFDMDTSKIYQLRMAAITINGTGVLSSWVESTYSGSPNKPGLPERLIIKPDMTSISLSWSRPKFTGSQVHGYIVGYGQFIPEAYRVVLPRTQQNYTINFLRPNSKYIVSVRAFNQIGESQPSLRKVRTLKATLKNIPLLAPVQLRVQSDSPTSLMVSWVDPVLGSSQEVLEGRSYVIRYSPLSGESYKYTGTVSLHRKLTGLKPATSYEISVKAVIANISSDWSLPVLNSTHQTTPSSAPQNITVQPVMGNPTELQLSWTEPQHSNGKILEYFIYRSLNPSLASKEWEIVATDQQAIRLKGILPHKVYYFRLQARNRVGYGPLSDIAVYKPPKERRSAPSNLTISSIHDNLDSVIVAWQPPQTAQEEITGYRVHYATLENAERKQWMVKFEKALNTIVEDLELNTTYHFKVRARYRNGFGPFSAAVTFKTPSEVTKQQPAEKFGSNDGAKFTPPTTESQVFTSLQTKEASENTFTNKVFPDKEQMLSSVPPQQTRTYEAFVPLDSHKLFPSSEMLRNITKPSDGSFNHSLIDANKEYSPADQHEEDGKGSVNNGPENLSVAPPAEEDQVYRYLAVNLENGKNSAPHSSEIQRSQRVLENTQLPLVESSTFFSEAHKSTRSVFEATQKPVSEDKSSRNETESVGETIFGRFQN